MFAAAGVPVTALSGLSNKANLSTPSSLLNAVQYGGLLVAALCVHKLRKSISNLLLLQTGNLGCLSHGNTCLLNPY